MIINSNGVYDASKDSLIFIHKISSCNEEWFDATVSLHTKSGRILESNVNYKIYYENIKHWKEVLV